MQQMQCLACGAEMRLHQIADDSTAPVTGFEHRTFECAACGDIERRLVFVGQVGPGRPDVAALHPTSAISPEHEAAPASAFGKRRFTKLYRIWRELARRQRSSAPGSDAGEPMPEPPVEQVPELAPALPHLIEPLPLPTAPRVSISPQTNSDLDECEVLLRRAIEIVHADTHSSETTANLAELGSETPVTTSVPVVGTPSPTPASVESRTSPPAPKPALIAVQIHHDPEKGKFVATDTKSGLSILRHQDDGWLRTMCDRMGWQIVDGAGEASGVIAGRSRRPPLASAPRNDTSKT
jgi:hypothetical protein